MRSASCSRASSLSSSLNLMEGGLNRSTQHLRLNSSCWGFNSEGFTWPFVELTHRFVYTA